MDIPMHPLYPLLPPVANVAIVRPPRWVVCGAPVPEQPADALVYLAGPLTSGDQVANMQRAHLVAGWLMAEADKIGPPGWLAVFIPHAYQLCNAGFPRDYEAWMRTTAVVLRRCNALYRLEGHSPGSDREMDMAHAAGLPVYRHTVAEATAMLHALRARGA